VRITEDAGVPADVGMFWKTWIGRASKNSCARIKGVAVSSIVFVSQDS